MSDLSARTQKLAVRMQASADELIDRGAIGVAAQLAISGAGAPIIIAAGESAPGRVMSGAEPFCIASQSKMFTAALVLLLAKRGEIKLDDPVSQYVENIPAVDDGATICQMLNHTSGIGNFIHALTTLAYPWPVMTYDDLMALARMHGRQFAPGARLDYNNTDVVVLARLCENVTGKSRARMLQEWVFDPLGMKDTMLGFGDAPRRARFAKGYYTPPAGPGGEVVVSEMPDLSLGGAAADITSTLPDLLRWVTALQKGENPSGLTLSDFVANIARTPPGLSPWFMPRAYGQGMESWDWGGRAAWGHRGSFFGYHSGTFVEPISGACLSMVLTMRTEGSFMSFIDTQAYGYMRFMGEALTLASVAAE